MENNSNDAAETVTIATADMNPRKGGAPSISHTIPAELPLVIGFRPVPHKARGKPLSDGIRHTHRARIVSVPKGHVLPGGEVVKSPFNVTLQFGVRWHPEWPEARVVFQAWQALAMGGAITFTGEKALAFLNDGDRRVFGPIAKEHGQRYAYETTPVSETLAMELGLDVPKQPEPLGAFILPCQITGGVA